MISWELNESHLSLAIVCAGLILKGSTVRYWSLASDRYPYYIIRSILFGAKKGSHVTHLKSTNDVVTKRVSILSLSTKMADSWNTKALCADDSKFLLHAAYEELNLIQTVTYIHPLQMMIKTLRAQMEFKTLTRVPPDKIASASSSEKWFSCYVSSSVSLYQCQVSIVVRRKHRANNFQAICKIHVSGPAACIHRHNFDY